MKTCLQPRSITLDYYKESLDVSSQVHSQHSVTGHVSGATSLRLVDYVDYVPWVEEPGCPSLATIGGIEPILVRNATFQSAGLLTLLSMNI